MQLFSVSSYSTPPLDTGIFRYVLWEWRALNGSFCISWGPIPWLYPPEVSSVNYCQGSIDVNEKIDLTSTCPC